MKTFFAIAFVLNVLWWAIFGWVLSLVAALICLGNVFDEMAETKNPP